VEESQINTATKANHLDSHLLIAC